MLDLAAIYPQQNSRSPAGSKLSKICNMQSPLWYYNRLRAMSGAEIAWRIRSEASEVIDLVKVRSGWRPVPAAATNQSSRGAFQISKTPLACWAGSEDELLVGWRTRLVEHAESILANRLSFFNLTDQFLGDPVNWHRDQNTGVEPPLKPIYLVDYRKAESFGDCKLVWEPNRHHQLVVLARAYRATGEERYAKGVVDTIDAWLDANPYGYGMNWRSPLELGIRVINWVCALDLIRESAALDDATFARIRTGAYQHCFDINRKYSQGSSANNHLIGEAAGAYVASLWFNFPQAWVQASQAILEEQARLQAFADGGTREQATGYQYFVLQFMLVAIIAGKIQGQTFSRKYLAIFKAMMRFMLELSGAGTMPYFGDYDDGYVIDLGNEDPRPAILRAMQAAVDSSAEVTTCEAAFWLDVLDRKKPDKPHHLASTAFPDSGYYLLQSPTDQASLVFDCGNLGFGSIAAHGHADALSFVLRLRGDDILVDPGTYDYFTYPDWRNHFRTTRAHNTIEIDGQDQSTMGGAFLWAWHAAARCRHWAPSDQGGAVAGVHHGYERLADPVSHERRIEMDSNRREIHISDLLTCSGSHIAKLHFHFDAACDVSQVSDSILAVRSANVICRMQLPEGQISLLEGSETPGNGWQSRRYHERVPSVTVSVEVQVTGTTRMESSLTWT